MDTLHSREVLVQHLSDACNSLRGTAQFVFPQPEHLPATLPKQAGNFSIAQFIARELGCPIACVGAGIAPVSGTPMPKTTIYKYREPFFPKDEVRFSMDALVTSPAHHAMFTKNGNEFKFGIFIPTTAYCRHASRPLLLCKNVRHSDSRRDDILPADW